MPSLSIVIPARNEAENLPSLLDEIAAALSGEQDYEIIVVDDASTDDSIAVLKAKAVDMPVLRILRHDRAGGQSAGVHSGVRAATGDIVCTLDGDGQNPPSNLPALIAPLRMAGNEDVGIVAGQRVRRQDTWSKKLASRFANALRSWMLKDGTRDTGCGLKAFRREAFLALPYFDHMHRYLPALFTRDGWRVVHVDVTHRQRGAGQSNYTNFQRALVGIVDLFGVAWLQRRRKKARPAVVER
jgi:dolichol-phosphate mannosyltransferase